EKAGKKIIPIYIEINIAEEKSKYGMVPDYKAIFKLIEKISSNLSHIRIEGLMTMGPEVEDKQSLRPYFRKAKKIFESLKTAKLPNVEMKVLSMGMSDSYQIAIEEGSNMVRIGTAIFGKREKYIF
ncbi:MAG: YggS family pyridoxal phosphate-dependent enzyme, partial [Actinobacteria bacterium]|nr:YggS family pyridoxal phosphate-dependent enzyme [Actinomycetota bacterium]